MFDGLIAVLLRWFFGVQYPQRVLFGLLHWMFLLFCFSTKKCEWVQHFLTHEGTHHSKQALAHIHQVTHLKISNDCTAPSKNASKPPKRLQKLLWICPQKAKAPGLFRCYRSSYLGASQVRSPRSLCSPAFAAPHPSRLPSRGTRGAPAPPWGPWSSTVSPEQPTGGSTPRTGPSAIAKVRRAWELGISDVQVLLGISAWG